MLCSFSGQKAVHWIAWIGHGRLLIFPGMASCGLGLRTLAARSAHDVAGEGRTGDSTWSLGPKRPSLHRMT